MANYAKKKLSALKSQDTSSLLLYALYKLKDVPGYATLCEIPYVFDQKTSDRLFEYYGGKTVTFPTKEEFLVMIRALWVYQEIEIGRHNPINVFAHITNDYPEQANEIIQAYTKLKELLENDEFAKQFSSNK